MKRLNCGYDDTFRHQSEIGLLKRTHSLHLESLSRAPLEVFMDIIQNRVAKDFGYSDDQVMNSLHKCLNKLQDDKMALPPQPKV